MGCRKGTVIQQASCGVCTITDVGEMVEFRLALEKVREDASSVGVQCIGYSTVS